MPAISICTQVKDRTAFLLPALQSWLAYPCAEIIIADWRSDEPLAKLITDFKDERLKYYYVQDEVPYNISRAKNFCIRQATSKWVLYLNGDVSIGPNFPKDFPDNDVHFYQGRGDSEIDKLNGCFLITKELFEAVNGFNEFLEGYGFEDADFYRRVLAIQNMWGKMFSGLTHQDHSDTLRAEPYAEKDLTHSTLRNVLRAKNAPWGKEFRQHRYGAMLFQPKKGWVLEQQI